MEVLGWKKYKISRLFLMSALSILCGCATITEESISPDHPDYVLVDVISRPLAKKGSIVPESTRGFHHLVIVSDLLPHGIWEMGPDESGNIVTTHTVNNLSDWREHKVTRECLELGGDYAKSIKVGINRNGFLDAINWYESYWVGQKYSKFSYNENYAVQSVIYAAGGKI